MGFGPFKIYIMLTPVQILAALKLSSAVVLNNVTAPFNTIQTSDITNWSGALGLNPATDTAKLIFNIINPLGIPVYTNVGWNTSSFAAPDTVFSNTPNLTGPLETLPVLTGSPTNEVISGAYSVYVMFSVVQGANAPVTGEGVFTTTINADLLLADPSITGTYACNTSPTTFTATDTTVLATTLYLFVSAVQSITVTPPVVSGQTPTTASGNTVTINNLWAPAPYQYNSSGTINYTLGLDTFAVNYTQSGYTDVICNTVLCAMYCWLTQISKEFACERNTTTKALLEQKLILGDVYYAQALRAQVCGDAGGFQSAIATFNKVTWFDGNCTCCDNLPPMPVIPSGAVGPAGANGLTPIFQFAGGWLQYKYTTGTQPWTNLYQPPAGVPGPAGANGTNGAAILWNDLTQTNNGTSVNVEVPLKSFTLPPNTVAGNLSQIIIETRITATDPIGNSFNFISFGGVNIVSGAGIDVIGGGSSGVEMLYKLTIVRISSNSAYYILERRLLGADNGNTHLNGTSWGCGDPTTFAPDFTVANAIVVSGASATASSSVCGQLTVKLEQLGVPGAGIVPLGVYANDIDAANNGVPLNQWYTTSGNGYLTQRRT